MVAEDRIAAGTAFNVIRTGRLDERERIQDILVVAWRLIENHEHLANFGGIVGEWLYLILCKEIRIDVEVRIAVDVVVAAVAANRVVAGAARDVVVVLAAIDRVVAEAAVDDQADVLVALPAHIEGINRVIAVIAKCRSIP